MAVTSFSAEIGLLVMRSMGFTLVVVKLVVVVMVVVVMVVMVMVRV